MAEEPLPFAIDPEVVARRRAALAHVRMWGDPVLRAGALAVERFDADLRGEVARMTSLMDDAIGAGLAATQLGVLHRLLVYRRDPDTPVRALVNPELEWASDEREVFHEGCLSLPGVWLGVERPVSVRVRARDEHGAEVFLEADGVEASVVQHEMDHLDGVLILDRTTREQRRDAIRLLRERASAPSADLA
jgi:peptide deformylase